MLLAGAGKTFTLGNVEPEAIGMVPRCIAEIFYQASVDPFHTYAVSMSYIQVCVYDSNMAGISPCLLASFLSQWCLGDQQQCVLA